MSHAPAQIAPNSTQKQTGRLKAATPRHAPKLDELSRQRWGIQILRAMIEHILAALS